MDRIKHRNGAWHLILNEIIIGLDLMLDQTPQMAAAKTRVDNSVGFFNIFVYINFIGNGDLDFFFYFINNYTSDGFHFDRFYCMLIHTL